MPFILPSDGLIGLRWQDPAAPYTVLNLHPGIDIFGTGEPGTVPVYAAYDGYLTRLPEWLSTVIIRHDDPLQAGRAIWTYSVRSASIIPARTILIEAASDVSVDLTWLVPVTLIAVGVAGLVGALRRRPQPAEDGPAA